MSKLLVLLSLSLVSALAADQTWTGKISDNICGADHSAMAQQGKKSDPHECTLTCAKGGGKFVFVSNATVYNIANQELVELKTHAGHAVQLTGDLGADGKTITVSNTKMKQ
jgi:hypothetical protein